MIFAKSVRDRNGGDDASMSINPLPIGTAVWFLRIQYTTSPVNNDAKVVPIMNVLILIFILSIYYSFQSYYHKLLQVPFGLSFVKK